jgi:AraC-like DNA-binding protein
VPLYSKLARVLHKHFHEPDLTPQKVAEKAGISRLHVLNIFSSAGTTFSQALLEIRLLKASEIL